MEGHEGPNALLVWGLRVPLLPNEGSWGGSHRALGWVTRGLSPPANLPSWPIATYLNSVVPWLSFILWHSSII